MEFIFFNAHIRKYEVYTASILCINSIMRKNVTLKRL